MEEENDFAGAQDGGSGGDSGGGNSGGGGSSGGSGGGGAGARGVDSSRQSVGELKGAYEVERDRYIPEYERPIRGAKKGQRQQRQQSQFQEGNQPYQGRQSSQGNYQPPVHVHLEGGNGGSNQENSMEKCTYYPVPFGGGFGGGYGYGAAPVAPAVGITATQAMQPVEDKSCDILLAIGNARSDIKDSESRTGDGIHHLQDTITSNQFALLGKICDAEKEAIRNNGELSARILASENTIARQIEMCCCDLKVANLENKQFITEKFCEVDKQFADADRREEKRIDAVLAKLNDQYLKSVESQLTECRIKENNADLINSTTNAIMQALKCSGLLTPCPTVPGK